MGRKRDYDDARRDMMDRETGAPVGDLDPAQTVEFDQLAPLRELYEGGDLIRRKILWPLQQVRCFVVGDDGDGVDGVRTRHSASQKTGQQAATLPTPVREVRQRVPGNAASSKNPETCCVKLWFAAQTTLDDPGLLEGCERYPRPGQRDDGVAHDR